VSVAAAAFVVVVRTLLLWQRLSVGLRRLLRDFQPTPVATAAVVGAVDVDVVDSLRRKVKDQLL